MSDNATRFVVTMTATGEVRDKDGVLLSSTPVEGELLLTTEEINALLEGQDR
jgi:hypothetical protein